MKINTTKGSIMCFYYHITSSINRSIFFSLQIANFFSSRQKISNTYENLSFYLLLICELMNCMVQTQAASLQILTDRSFILVSNDTHPLFPHTINNSYVLLVLVHCESILKKNLTAPRVIVCAAYMAHIYMHIYVEHSHINVNKYNLFYLLKLWFIFNICRSELNY